MSRGRSTGPYFRVTATIDGADAPIGHIMGFAVAIAGYVHLDEMRVSNAALRAEASGTRGLPGAFGAGLLMGTFALCKLRDMGCRSAELLAINDNAYQYRRLVRYYERMGFRSIREVGAGESPFLVELCDQLTWGGAGMLMAAEVDDVLRKWSRAFDAKEGDA